MRPLSILCTRQHSFPNLALNYISRNANICGRLLLADPSRIYLCNKYIDERIPQGLKVTQHPGSVVCTITKEPTPSALQEKYTFQLACGVTLNLLISEDRKIIFLRPSRSGMSNWLHGKMYLPAVNWVSFHVHSFVIRGLERSVNVGTVY